MRCFTRVEGPPLDKARPNAFSQTQAVCEKKVCPLTGCPPLVLYTFDTGYTVGDTVLEIGTGNSVSLISKEIDSLFSALQQNQARFLNSLIFLGLNPVSQFLRPDF